VVHATGVRVGHDIGRIMLRCLVTKHSRSQAQGGNLQIAFVKGTVLDKSHLVYFNPSRTALDSGKLQ
jgi:hypothetical protein